MNKERAVVLVSGGLDSATALAMAMADGFDCYALSFEYGQRCMAELDAARQVAKDLGAIKHQVVHIDLGKFGGSALTDTSIDVPETETDTLSKQAESLGLGCFDIGMVTTAGADSPVRYRS